MNNSVLASRDRMVQWRPHTNVPIHFITRYCGDRRPHHGRSLGRSCAYVAGNNRYGVLKQTWMRMQTANYLTMSLVCKHSSCCAGSFILQRLLYEALAVLFIVLVYKLLYQFVSSSAEVTRSRHTASDWLVELFLRHSAWQETCWSLISRFQLCMTVRWHGRNESRMNYINVASKIQIVYQNSLFIHYRGAHSPDYGWSTTVSSREPRQPRLWSVALVWTSSYSPCWIRPYLSSSPAHYINKSSSLST